MGASWGPGGKNAWTEKVGEDARHLQVIRDVKSQDRGIEKDEWKEVILGKKRKYQRGSRETQGEQLIKGHRPRLVGVPGGSFGWDRAPAIDHPP